jgi:copper resistance protein B
MKILVKLFVWISLFSVMGQANLASAQEKALVFYGAQFEEFEYRKGDDGEDFLTWDGDVFIGTDEVKLRWLSEGEYDQNSNSFEALENRLVLQMPISTFFDMRGGVRVDTPKGVDRWYGVLGVTGLAQQWFEVDADLFVSENGNASARLEVAYELLLTNYWILTPSAEINVALSSDREIGIGSGINDIELGARLSYDVIDRSFSPYLGVVYERKLGQTADFARDENDDLGGWRLAIGARLMF